MNTVLDRIEVRFPTEEEFNDLLENATLYEKKYLLIMVEKYGITPYEYILVNTKERNGLFIDGKLVYYGGLTPDNYLWTTVRNDIKEQFTLYKLSKRMIYKWLNKYGVIYATMEKGSPKNIEWTKRIGFKIIKEDDKIITLKLGG